VATDYGGTHGSQPRPGAQPSYPGRPDPGQPPQGQPPYGQQPPRGQQPPYGGQQPPYGQPPYGQPPYPGRPPQSGPPGRQPPHGSPPSYGPPSGQPWHNGPVFPDPPQREPSPHSDTRTRRRRRSIAWTLLAVGGIALAFSAFGAADQGGPRKFTAKETQQITDWEYAKRWRTLPAGSIFPASVTYSAPEALDDDPSLTLAADRVGIAKQASCTSAADPSAVAVLNRDGCSTMLRATYVDETDSFVVTVGAAVLPTSAEAQTAAQAIKNAPQPGGLGATVHAVSFKGTPAGQFTDKQRQLSGVTSRGTYVVLYTVGYADSRQKQRVAQDTYTDKEMTSAGEGVADHVLSTLAAPVPPPHCPSAETPGC
jgi:hypothetical protein